MSEYIEKLDFMKTLENKIFTLNDTRLEKFGDNKFTICNDENYDFTVLVLDEIGWVESIISFGDILRGCFTVKDILGERKEKVNER